MREIKYWEDEEAKKCRICRREREKESWQKVVKRMFGEEGEGEKWTKEMQKKRRVRE